MLRIPPIPTPPSPHHKTAYHTTRLWVRARTRIPKRLEPDYSNLFLQYCSDTSLPRRAKWWCGNKENISTNSPPSTAIRFIRIKKMFNVVPGKGARECFFCAEVHGGRRKRKRRRQKQKSSGVRVRALHHLKMDGYYETFFSSPADSI